MRKRGFTIIEIEIVILFIALLAVGTFIGYNTITNNAVILSLRSDLNNAAEELDIFQFKNNQYPNTINCSIPDSATNVCVKFGRDVTANYVPYNNEIPDRYYLSLTSRDITYKIIGTASSDIPVAVDSLVKLINCPNGFIWVPGSSTYQTGDFCVMKYEAKNVSGVATSQTSLTPWMNVTQVAATSLSSAVCTYCHLITESEWLTIAQNIIKEPRNWSNGSVGGGYVYKGHDDNAPANTLEASANDSDGYFNTGQSSGNQKRTLFLSNDEVIWDFAGNAMEWTSGQIGPNQQPSPSGAAYREWTAVSGGTFLVNPYPSGIGINGSAGWNSSKGIGQIWSDSSDTNTRGFARGGAFNWHPAGVLSLSLGVLPTAADAWVLSFRVAR